ncbi:MAG: hypothetical protein JKY20_13270 [Alphaproteobacteria bacterium]|nr:hypothetical protein [Alphaproteobacteria bacterium]
MTAEPEKYRPFLFEHDFGDADIRAEEAQEPEEELVPSFSEEELEAAKQQAFQAGHAAGFKESNDSFEHRIAESLDIATASFSRLTVAQATANEKMTQDGLRLAAKLVETMMPALVEQHGDAEIETAVTQVLQGIIETPAITITVHDDLVEKMTGCLQTIAQQAGLDENLMVNGDPSLGLSDCRVSWGEGGAVRDFDAVWSQAEAALDRNLTPDLTNVTAASTIPNTPPAPTLETEMPEIAEITEIEAPIAAATPDAIEPPAFVSPVPPDTGLGIASTITAEPVLATPPQPLAGAEGAPDALHVTEPAGLDTPPIIPEIISTPTASNTIAAALPGAVAAELPGAVAAELPGAVAAELPGAVAPGLPVVIPSASKKPDPTLT